MPKSRGQSTKKSKKRTTNKGLGAKARETFEDMKESVENVAEKIM
jgi:hypothetical protein